MVQTMKLIEKWKIPTYYKIESTKYFNYIQNKKKKTYKRFHKLVYLRRRHTYNTFHMCNLSSFLQYSEKGTNISRKKWMNKNQSCDSIKNKCMKTKTLYKKDVPRMVCDIISTIILKRGRHFRFYQISKTTVFTTLYLIKRDTIPRPIRHIFCHSHKP